MREFLYHYKNIATTIENIGLSLARLRWFMSFNTSVIFIN